MNTSQNPPRATRDSACGGGRPAAAASHANLAIENLTEIADACVPDMAFCVCYLVDHVARETTA